MAPAQTKTPAIPRLSASLVVINHRNELLLVHRNPKSGTFAGMHVRVVVRLISCSESDILLGLPWRQLRRQARRFTVDYGSKGDI